MTLQEFEFSLTRSDFVNNYPDGQELWECYTDQKRGNRNLATFCNYHRGVARILAGIYALQVERQWAEEKIGACFE